MTRIIHEILLTILIFIMKILILALSFVFSLSADEDVCDVTISNGTETVTCVAATCAEAKACAIAGWEAMH